MSLAFAVEVKERLVALEETLVALEKRVALVEEKTNGYIAPEGKHRAARKTRVRVSDGGLEPSQG